MKKERTFSSVLYSQHLIFQHAIEYETKICIGNNNNFCSYLNLEINISSIFTRNSLDINLDIIFNARKYQIWQKKFFFVFFLIHFLRKAPKKIKIKKLFLSEPYVYYSIL